MRTNRWLATAAFSAAALAAPHVQAGLFDRIVDDADRSETASTDEDRDSLRFAVADAGEIGKIVSPVSFQPLAAPGSDGTLTPVPEPAPIPMAAPAYGGPTPAGYPIESVPTPVYPPLPEYPLEGTPFAGPMSPIGPMLPGDGFPLFDRVKYEDRDHIHPHAVPTIVQVLDPCSDKARGGLLRRLHADDDCDACGPQCVFVEICVPPGCPEIKVSRGGRKVKYDYGDYKVEILSKDGVVYVDYDD